MRGSAISALSNTSTRADYHEQASAAANKNSQQFLPQIVKEHNKNWKKKLSIICLRRVGRLLMFTQILFA